MAEHRRRYPHLPAGHYAVTGSAGRETYWSVDEAGRLRDYPPGVRWRPSPPPVPAHVPRADRPAWRADWYERTYWPFKTAVADAIADDPLAAMRRFRAALEAGRIPAAPPSRRRSGEAEYRRSVSAAQRRAAIQRRVRAGARRDAEAMAAAAMVSAGMPVRRVAALLGVPLATAHRRIVAGRAMLADSSDPVTTWWPRIGASAQVPGVASDDQSDADREVAR